MFTITKQFTFEAAHHLPHLAARQPDHQCARPHGHSYTVELVLESDALNGDSFVRDFGELREFKAFVDGTLDHRDLNEVFHPMPTTAENIARALFDRFRAVYPELVSVRVSETAKTWATYRPAMHAPLSRGEHAAQLARCVGEMHLPGRWRASATASAALAQADGADCSEPGCEVRYE